MFNMAASCHREIGLHAYSESTPLQLPSGPPVSTWCSLPTWLPGASGSDMHGAVFRTKGHRQISGGGRPARTNESRWPSRRPLAPRGRSPTARAAHVRASRSIRSDASGMRVRKRCRFTAGAVWSSPQVQRQLLWKAAGPEPEGSAPLAGPKGL